MRQQATMRLCLLLLGTVIAAHVAAEDLKATVKSSAMVALETSACPDNTCCTTSGVVIQACPMTGGVCCGSSGFCCPQNYQCGSSLLQQPACILNSGPISTPTQTRSVIYVGGTKTFAQDMLDLRPATDNALFQRPTYITPPSKPATIIPARAINLAALGFGPSTPSLSSVTFAQGSDSSNVRCTAPTCVAMSPVPSACTPCPDSQPASDGDQCCDAQSSAVSSTLSQLSSLSASLSSASSQSGVGSGLQAQLREIAKTLSGVVGTLASSQSLSSASGSSELKSAISQSASSLSSALSAMSSSLSSAASESGSSSLARSLSSISSALSSLSSSSGLSSALSSSAGESTAASSLSSILSALSSESATGSSRPESSASMMSSLSAALSRTESAKPSGGKPARKMLIKVLKTVIAQLEAAAAGSSGQSLSSLSAAVSSLSSSLADEDRQRKRMHASGLTEASNEPDGSALSVSVRMAGTPSEARKANVRAAAVDQLKAIVNQIGKVIPAVSNPLDNMVPMHTPPAGWVKPIDPTDYWKWEEPYSSLPVRRMQRCGPWNCNEWMRPDQLLTNAPTKKFGPKMHFEVPVHVAINRPLLMTKTVNDMLLKSGKHIKATTRTYHTVPVRTVTITKIPEKPAVTLEPPAGPAPPPLPESTFPAASTILPPPPPASSSSIVKPKPKVKPGPKSKTRVNQHVELNIGRPILQDV